MWIYRALAFIIMPYKNHQESRNLFIKEAKKLYHYIKGGDNDTPQYKKELMFIQLLEGLHETEAKLVINAKDKKLHQIYKGLSKEVVKEAFGWNDEFAKA